MIGTRDSQEGSYFSTNCMLWGCGETSHTLNLRQEPLSLSRVDRSLMVFVLFQQTGGQHYSEVLIVVIVPKVCKSYFFQLVANKFSDTAVGLPWHWMKVRSEFINVTFRNKHKESKSTCRCLLNVLLFVASYSIISQSKLSGLLLHIGEFGWRLMPNLSEKIFLVCNRKMLINRHTIYVRI